MKSSFDLLTTNSTLLTNMSYYTPSRFLNKNAFFLVCLFLIFPVIQIVGQEQVGRPSINNYTYQEYGAGPVNWWALEDNDGIMYFANGAGVLQYDGVNWNTIPMKVSARCLTKDKDGII